MQSAGLEWTFRLISEPRRLYRRYLLQDLPFAVKLLAGSAMVRLRRSVGVAHMDQSNHEYHPLRAESQAAKMGSGPLADGLAGPSEFLVTPPDLPAGSLPVSPSPIASGLSATDSTQRSATQVRRIRSKDSR